MLDPDEKYKSPGVRVMEHLAEVKKRDAEYSKYAYRSSVVVFSMGSAFGILMSLIARSGLMVGLLLTAASGGALLLCKLRDAEIIESMLVYLLCVSAPFLLMVEFNIIVADTFYVFTSILVAMMGMSLSYLLGWVRSFQ